MKLNAILLLSVVLIAGCVTPSQNGTAPQTATVEITPNGFEPQIVSVAQGGTVTWLNRDMVEHWPASAVHPTHRAYPGSGIEKCGSGEAIFDACHPLANTGTFAFTFSERGEWRYHDHLNPSFTGAVVVR